MKGLRYVVFLPLMIALLWGQGVSQSRASASTSKSATLVNGLYQQVVARRPLGIPFGADLKAFAPYLSKGLLHRFDVNNACFADWRKRNPDPSLKPPVGLIENGLFSGGDEEAQAQAFHIEKTDPGKNGSSRVYVRLTVGDPPNKPLVWDVAVVLVRENGRPVVDGVIYLKDKNNPSDVWLSKLLSDGCDGPRWVGEGNRPR